VPLPSLEISADSLFAAIVLSAAVAPRRYALFVALFAICDSGGSFAGSLLPVQIDTANLVAPIFLVSWGGLVLLGLAGTGRPGGSQLRPYLLPPLMGFDNLVRPDCQWAASGLASGAMAALGFVTGFVLLRPSISRWSDPRRMACPIILAGLLLSVR
jgi:hypothetical protein